MTQLMHHIAANAARVSSVLVGVLPQIIRTQLETGALSQGFEQVEMRGQIDAAYPKTSEKPDSLSKNARFTTFLRPALNWCPRAKSLPVASI